MNCHIALCFRHLAVALFLLAVVLLTGCRERESANAQRYELKGVVVSVDQRGETLSIAHHEIRGYMDAMTMAFKPKEKWVLDKAKTGDQIQATLVVDGLRSWLENVVITEETTDPAAAAAKPTEPQPGDAVAEFSLINQDGKRISLKDYRGRALAITFIYTRCPLPDYCPLITDHFAEIAKTLKTDAEALKTTHLLSISVDPEYDTPAILREYGAKYTGESGVQTFRQWEFASGKAADVKQVATYFGLEYWAEDNQIVHSMRTAVVGPDGRLVKLYHGSEWEPAEVAAELQKLKPAALAIATADAAANAAVKGSAKEKPPAGPRIYRGTGVVAAIAENRKTIELNHEDIKDLMPAMDMSFEVSNPALLDGISVGDRVDFGLQSLPHGIVVVEIRKR